MARSPAVRPTDGELEILHVFWKCQNATIRDVHDELVKKRPVAHTTVATMVQLMARKGLLELTDRRRPQKYRATRDMSNTSDLMIKDLVRRLFHGSPMKLAMQLFSGKKPATPEQQAKIKSLLDDLE